MTEDTTTDSTSGIADGGFGATGKPEAAVETARGTLEQVELSRLQQNIARRTSEAKATVPHLYLSIAIDMSECVRAQADMEAGAAGDEVTPTCGDMIVRASAIALREVPTANGSYRDGQIELHSRVNVGVTVADRESLVTPVVTDADRRGPTEIATVMRDLSDRVREGLITQPDLSGGTFTVSNLGTYGVSSFDAIINSPQAAVLAVGAIEERPVVRNGEIVAAKMMSVTLSCDHRILYGAEAAGFLARIRQLLEKPVSLEL